jgi:hypothetical protein
MPLGLRSPSDPAVAGIRGDRLTKPLINQTFVGTTVASTIFLVRRKPMTDERGLDGCTYERLREQFAAAAARCSSDQVLDLADTLHASIRRRRQKWAKIEPSRESVDQHG